MDRFDVDIFMMVESIILVSVSVISAVYLLGVGPILNVAVRLEGGGGRAACSRLASRTLGLVEVSQEVYFPLQVPPLIGLQPN